MLPACVLNRDIYLSRFAWYFLDRKIPRKWVGWGAPSLGHLVHLTSQHLISPSSLNRVGCLISCRGSLGTSWIERFDGNELAEAHRHLATSFTWPHSTSFLLLVSIEWIVSFLIAVPVVLPRSKASTEMNWLRRTVTWPPRSPDLTAPHFAF
jgi:hypothetical protein